MHGACQTVATLVLAHVLAWQVVIALNLASHSVLQNQVVCVWVGPQLGTGVRPRHTRVALAINSVLAVFIFIALLLRRDILAESLLLLPVLDHEGLDGGQLFDQFCFRND